MLAALVVSVISMIFLIIGAIGLSTTQANIKACPWSIGTLTAFNDSVELGTVDTYVGLAGFVVDSSIDGFEDFSQNWGDHNCSQSAFGEDFCEDCETNAATTVQLIILAIVTQVPQIQTDVQRSTRNGDLNCQRFMAIFTGILGTLSTLAGLINYIEACDLNLPSEITYQGFNVTAQWSPGMSFILVWFATVLKLFDVVCHLLVLTPPEKRDESYTQTKAGGNPCAGTIELPANSESSTADKPEQAQKKQAEERVEVKVAPDPAATTPAEPAAPAEPAEPAPAEQAEPAAPVQPAQDDGGASTE